MDDTEILARVGALVDEEHRLRESAQRGDLAPERERARLAELEVALDQCWDLLRQRRARRDAGADPDRAGVRPPDEVEGYQQ
ncbi:DUF2630 family protein [Actinokineospora diospyrosa]|uniref:DUF2630 family protein n=1 Tax=Actinokineospora diospyrosa TaxID=103728 RepID=A0ABT1I8V5_9PSEU|nr:DUF2630 family protein [Actinokineospora diospyrosa]MCP2269064.1 Protein of unknown function (DUF2630) [Actinokineospora diospyrosa]